MIKAALYQLKSPPLNIPEICELIDDEEKIPTSPEAIQKTTTTTDKTDPSIIKQETMISPLKEGDINKQESSLKSAKPDLKTEIFAEKTSQWQQHQHFHHQQQQQHATIHQRRGVPGYRFFQEPIRRWYPLRIKLDPPKRSRLDAVEQKEYLQFHAKFKDRTKLTNEEVRFYKKYLVFFFNVLLFLR